MHAHEKCMILIAIWPSSTWLFLQNCVYKDLEVTFTTVPGTIHTLLKCLGSENSNCCLLSVHKSCPHSGWVRKSPILTWSLNKWIGQFERICCSLDPCILKYLLHIKATNNFNVFHYSRSDVTISKFQSTFCSYILCTYLGI